MRRILAVVVPLCIVLLASCASNRRSDAMNATLNAYANTLRWGDFASAALFVDPQLRQEHAFTPIQLSRMKQYTVSDYDDGPGPVPTGPDDLRQSVVISLTNNHTQTVHSVTDRQTWHYDKAANKWWLTSLLPDIAPTD